MGDEREIVVPRDREHLLELIRGAHEPLEASLNRASDEQMVAALLDGGWSVKDLLAHITAWEQITLYHVRKQALGENPPEPGPEFADVEGVDDLNARFYAKHKDDSLAEVRQEFARGYAEVLSVLANVPDEKFFIEVEGRPLWRGIAGDTYIHYPEHRAQVESVTREV